MNSPEPSKQESAAQAEARAQQAAKDREGDEALSYFAMISLMGIKNAKATILIGVILTFLALYGISDIVEGIHDGKLWSAGARGHGGHLAVRARDSDDFWGAVVIDLVPIIMFLVVGIGEVRYGIRRISRAQSIETEPQRVAAGTLPASTRRTEPASDPARVHHLDTKCPNCSGDIQAHDSLHFCPYCGSDQIEVQNSALPPHCHACGRYLKAVGTTDEHFIGYIQFCNHCGLKLAI
jgi:hypothetical protein